MEEILNLGGHIELSGFSGLDGGSMVILKKIVGNYARKFSAGSSGFEKLSLKMGSADGVGSQGRFTVEGTVINNGKAYSSSLADCNLFIVLDRVLKSIESDMQG